MDLQRGDLSFLTDFSLGILVTDKAVGRHYAGLTWEGGSRGPRARAGNARASRNARRRGLAAFNNKDPAMAGRVKQMVDAICQGNEDPLLREQAVAFAESQLWLDCVLNGCVISWHTP